MATLGGDQGQPLAAELAQARTEIAALKRQLAAREAGASEAGAFAAEDGKQVAAALQASQQMLDEIISALPVRVFWKDRDLVYLGCNAAFARDAGLSAAQDIIGKTDEQLVWHEQAALYCHDDREVIRSGIARHLIEEPTTTPEGETITLLTTKVPLRDADGQIYGVLGTYLDISARKQTEEALRQSEALLNEVGRVAEIGGWEMDLQTRTAQWTPVTYDLVGIPTGSPVPGPDQHLAYFLEQDRPAVAEAMRALIVDELPLDIEARAEDGSRGVRWFRALGRAERVDGVCRRIFGTLQDITQRKHAEQEQARLEAQLRQAQKMESVGRLAGGVAHDFNNMLGVILGHVDLAIEAVGATQPLRSDLEEIKAAAQRSADLTRQLLTFARKQTVTPHVLDLRKIVESTFGMLRRLIGEDIAFDWRASSDLSPVKMDPSQIDQILVNLCVNARDAITGVGKVRIELANQHVDARDGGSHAGLAAGPYVRLTVSDDGCGMDEETLRQIFEPFFTTKAKGQGTGLGLATVYGIVQQSGGSVEVDSAPGRGTTCAVFLPCYRGQTDELLPAVHVGVESRAAETILVVEDEPSILRIVGRILTRFGYRVLLAGSPKEALNLARGHGEAIELLVSDVVMPEMNGHELAEQLRPFCPRVKRLFMSGHTAKVIARHGVLAEGVHFIAKPFSSSELAAKVAQALGRT